MSRVETDKIIEVLEERRKRIGNEYREASRAGSRQASDKLRGRYLELGELMDVIKRLAEQKKSGEDTDE